jgi:signal transduction histidine kinase
MPPESASSDRSVAGGSSAERVRIFRVLPPFRDDAALQSLLADTLAAVVTLQEAASGVLMLVDPEAGDLYPAASVNLTDEYLERVGRVRPGAGACGTALAENRPVVIEDTEADPLFLPYVECARLAGYRAVYSMPLKGRDGQILGTLATYSTAPRRPSRRDRVQAELYARLAGSAIDNVLAHRHATLQSERRTEAEGAREQLVEREQEAKRRSDFLAEASRLLGTSLEYEPTLATVAGLALPFLASWCFVDLVEPDGSMRRVAVIHPDPEKQRLARMLENGWPPERDDPLGAPRAVRTRASEILAQVPDEVLVQAAHGEENLRILRALGIGSLIVAPLISRDQVLGAITFVSADTGHQYTADDLLLADEVASRSAVAIENARLLRAAERVRREAEQARMEAEEANRAKSVFLSTMSHELRTPLNAIGGYAELLEMELKGPLTVDQHDQIHRIRTNQRHLLSLVNAVLDFARLDAGRMEYDIQPVPVSAAIRDMESVVAPLAEAKGIGFPRECANDHLVVLADREKLVQILVNLFTNAVKFTRHGGQVSLRCELEDGRVLFRVVDSGIGIPPDQLEHIFEPFVQVSEGHTRKEEGTGLGLAISRNLARGMNGELTVESVTAKGSTFTVALPHAADAQLAADMVVPVLGFEDRWSGEERRSGEDRRMRGPGSEDPILV